MTNQELIKTYFEYVNEGRWDDYVELFADDIVMDEQLLGRVEGKESLRKAVEPLKSAPQFRNEPLQILVEGNRAVALWHLTTVSASGAAIDCRGANYFELADSKIKYFANFHDTAPFSK